MMDLDGYELGVLADEQSSKSRAGGEQLCRALQHFNLLLLFSFLSWFGVSAFEHPPVRDLSDASTKSHSVPAKGEIYQQHGAELLGLPQIHLLPYKHSTTGVN